MADPLTIDRDELRDGLAAGELIAIMTMGDDAYAMAHIPGSIHIASIGEATQFPADAPLVVYCTDPACPASASALDALIDAGYTNVRHYRGGLSDWTSAGYPLDGTQITPATVDDRSEQ